MKLILRVFYFCLTVFVKSPGMELVLRTTFITVTNSTSSFIHLKIDPSEVGFKSTPTPVDVQDVHISTLIQIEETGIIVQTVLVLGTYYIHLLTISVESNCQLRV